MWRWLTKRPTKQPKLHLPRSPLEIVADAVAGLAVLACWLVPLITWVRLPETIPTHFNWAGEADDWSGRSVLLIMPAVATFIFGLMTVISFFPHLWNYPWRITEENAARQYRLARGFVAILKLELLVLLGLLEWALVASADQGALASGFRPVIVAIIVLPAITALGYIVRGATTR